MLDRELQHRILTSLAEAYPRRLTNKSFGLKQEEPAWVSNIVYLAEHRLVEAKSTEMLDGTIIVTQAKITAAGLDHLQDDGGLGAILGVVTIRLEADTLRALLADKVGASAIPEEQKSRLRKWLESAGADALKQATTKLVTAAFEKGPAAAAEILEQLTGR
jgi:hypothetical protein